MKNYGPWIETRESALLAEKLGFASVWLNDHLLPPAGPLDAQFREAWTSLSALGAMTHRVKLGTLVVCNSFRNPGLLGKMASTLDSITDGRVILGIGAGWHKPEYEAYGYQFPSVGERIARLEESVRILTSMFRDGSVTFHGKYYNVKDALAIRVEGHSIPVWIGGGGPRVVRMAARLANGWNSYRMRRDDLRKRHEDFTHQLKAAGRDEQQVPVSLVTDCLVAESKSGVDSLVAAAASERGMPAERYHLDDSVIFGNSEEAIKSISDLENIGVRHLILNFPSRKLGDQMQFFSDEVMTSFS